MKMHEIKDMNNEELIKRIEEEEKNLVDLKFQNATKTLTNTGKISITRRDIAKMRTLLRQRELEAQQ